MPCVHHACVVRVRSVCYACAVCHHACAACDCAPHDEQDAFDNFVEKAEGAQKCIELLQAAADALKPTEVRSKLDLFKSAAKLSMGGARAFAAASDLHTKKKAQDPEGFAAKEAAEAKDAALREQTVAQKAATRLKEHAQTGPTREATAAATEAAATAAAIEVAATEAADEAAADAVNKGRRAEEVAAARAAAAAVYRASSKH